MDRPVDCSVDWFRCGWETLGLITPDWALVSEVCERTATPMNKNSKGEDTEERTSEVFMMINLEERALKRRSFRTRGKRFSASVAAFNSGRVQVKRELAGPTILGRFSRGIP